jgi:hypothetical protein
MENFTNMDFFRDVAKNEYVTPGPHKHLVDVLPKEYIQRMQELSNDYKNIKWLPLDIPKIELDNQQEFFEIWNSQSVDIVRQRTDVAEPWSKEDHPLGTESSWNKAQFKGLTLWRHPMVPSTLNPFSSKKYDGEIKQFDGIVEQVFEYYPMHTVVEIFLWESIIPIGPHRDESSYWQCPTEFRTMLYDENDQPTLYVVDVEHGDKHYIDLPESTNSFCWSNGKQIHGSDFFNKRKVILCVSGIQHSTKSRDLFERSVSKYKDQLNYKLDL